MSHERTVYFNGSFIPEKEANISIYDAALATGVKAVEVTRTFHQVPHGLDAHLERLYRGLDTLHIEPGITRQELAVLTDATLRKNIVTQPEFVDWQIIHYVTSGPAEHFEIVPEEELRPTVIIHCLPLVNRIGKMAKKYFDGVDLVVVPQRAIPQDILPPQIKSAGRQDQVIGRLEAKQLMPGATGVLLDTNGYITEGTGTSLFFVINGVIQTAPDSRVLPGVTRKLIYTIAEALHIPIGETDLTVEGVRQADEAFVTSTVICLMHGRSFNKKMIGTGGIGAVTKNVRDSFFEEVGLNFVEQAKEYAEYLTREGPVR